MYYTYTLYVHIHKYTHKHIIIYFNVTTCCESLLQTKTAPAAPTASSGGKIWPQIIIDSYTYSVTMT